MTGLVTGMYDIGCAIGAVAAFVWGENLGRKKSIILANVIVIVGAAIQTACYSYAQMAVARVIAGVGVGLSTVSVPILQSETLPSHNRGALLVVQSALIIIGVAIASWLCFATLYANSSLQWRFPIACQIVFSMLVLCCCPFLPETPRWLAKHGRDDEARHTITRLLNKSEDDPEVKGQLNEILETIAAESGDGEPTWSEVFSNATKSRNLQRVLLGMGPYMMNQWSGASYGPSFTTLTTPLCLLTLHRNQRPLLLPGLHPRNLPELLLIHVSHPRFSSVHSIRRIFLAAVFLHRPDRTTLDSDLLVYWLCCLHGRYSRMSA